VNGWHGPRVIHNIRSGVYLFEWTRDGQTCQLSIQPDENDGVLREVTFTGGMRGVLPTAVHDAPLATLERLALDHVRDMLDHRDARPGEEFFWPDFSGRNAYPVRRARGPREVPEVVLAAVSALYATGRSRDDIAQTVGFSVPTIKRWIQTARARDILAAHPSRDLTDTGTRILDADGRAPAAILTAFV